MPRVRRVILEEGENPPRGLRFHCPGCDEAHIVRVGGPNPPWTWSGDFELPTIVPSVKVEQPKWDEARREFVADRICHSHVERGSIRYLGDCTHAMVGRTVPLPELPVE